MIWSVKELISMIGDNIIDIAPEYQRRFRWDEERQSTLIESISRNTYPSSSWQQMQMEVGKLLTGYNA